MKSPEKAVTVVLSLSETFSNDNFESDIQALEAESMGWVYVSEGAYLHEGSDGSGVIQVVGIAHPSMSESNVLWLL
jgi:hypothetical protein